MQRTRRSPLPLRSVIAVLAIPSVLLFPSTVLAQAVSPTNYNCFDATQTTGIGEPFTQTCTAESPFAQNQRDGDFQYFHFEDWESFSLNLFVNPIPTSLPGVTVSGGGGGGVTVGGFSPDADDGVIDNLSDEFAVLQTAFSIAGTISIDFDAPTLGALPSHAGVVVTTVSINMTPIDVTAEFFSAGGVSLGTVNRQFNQTSLNDSTDDAFMGWIHSDGIESITVSNNPTQGINVDHLQYGLITPAVPTFSAASRAGLLLLVGATAILALARKRRAHA